MPQDAIIDSDGDNVMFSVYSNAPMQHSILATVPIEIIQAIGYQTEDIESAIRFASTCKRIRAAVLPILNQMEYSIDIRTSTSWYLPLTKREKRPFFSASSVGGKTSEADGSVRLYWYRYIKQCRHIDNYSMRNRFRIWKIVNFICDDLVKRDLLTEVQV